MLVLLVQFTLRLSDCRSLKEKRAVVKPLLNGFRQRFNVSVAESAHADSHTLATITVAALCAHRAMADSVAQQLMDFVTAETGLDLFDLSVEVM